MYPAKRLGSSMYGAETSEFWEYSCEMSYAGGHPCKLDGVGIIVIDSVGLAVVACSVGGDVDGGGVDGAALTGLLVIISVGLAVVGCSLGLIVGALEGLADGLFVEVVGLLDGAFEGLADGLIVC